MGLFGNRKKKSNDVAKERLKLLLVYDRAGTASNNDMIEMMKRDIMQVISKYIVIDESDLDLAIRTSRSDEGTTSELAVSIPIKQVKQIGRNRY